MFFSAREGGEGSFDGGPSGFDAPGETRQDGSTLPDAAAGPRIEFGGCPGTTTERSATISFAGVEIEDSFVLECRFDDGDFGPCTSPVEFQKLSTEYHVLNVRARDNNDVTLAEGSCEWTISSAAVVLFNSNFLYLGDLGGRTGADLKCQNELLAGYADLEGLEAHAFLCVDSMDAVAFMPANFDLPPDVPVVGAGDLAGDTPLAASWSSFATGVAGLDSDFASVGVLDTGGLSQAWSGCAANGGELPAQTCAGWTSQAQIDTGGMIRDDNTSASWLAAGGPSGCDFSRFILCVAY